MKTFLLIVVAVALCWFAATRFFASNQPVASRQVASPSSPPVRLAQSTRIARPITPPSSKTLVETFKAGPTPVPSYPEMSLAEMLGPNNFFHDDLFGVSASVPEGWTIHDAQRWGENNRENTVWMTTNAETTASPSMYYQMYPNGAPDTGATEAYFRDIAQKKEDSRIASGRSDYKNVPESFAFSEIDGHPSLSYFATFTAGDQVMTEYFVRILGEKGYVMFFTSGKLEDVRAIMPQVKQMAASVKPP